MKGESGTFNTCISELQQQTHPQRLELEDAHFGYAESRTEQVRLFTQQAFLYFGTGLKNLISCREFCRYHHRFQILKRILHRNPLLLRRHWTDWRKNCSKNQFNGFITTVKVNVFHSFSFLFNIYLSKALVAWIIGCPLFAKLIIIFTATSSHCPSGFHTWVPHHFFSGPGSRNNQYPSVNLRVYSVTSRAFAIHFFLCSLVLSKQWRWTLTSRWSFLGSAQVHTLNQKSLSSGSRREFPK